MLRKFKEMKEVIVQATPGPYKYDCGNGDIESEHDDHWRCSVIDRPDLTDRHNHYESFNLKIKPPESPKHPDSDMEYAALAMNQLPIMILALEQIYEVLKLITCQNELNQINYAACECMDALDELFGDKQ